MSKPNSADIDRNEALADAWEAEREAVEQMEAESSSGNSEMEREIASLEGWWSRHASI